VRIQFASGRQQLPFTSGNVTVITGSLTTAKTLYFALLGENPAGVNKLSAIVGSVTIGAGQGVSVAIPATAHSAGDFFESYVLAASTSNTPASFVQLAKLPARDGDGSPVSLPATLTLDSDDHLALSAIVATPNELPTDPLHGMLRQVTSLGKIFEYDADSLLEPNDTTVLAADIGAWVWHPGDFSVYVAATTDGGGCDRPLSQVTVTPLRAPRYTPDGATGAQRVFWIFNNDTVPYPAGNRVGLTLTLNDIPQDSRWNGLLSCKFLGYAKPSNGTLRTIYSDGSSFPDVGAEKPYETTKSDLILPDDLQPGEAYALAVYPAFTPAELNGEVPNNSVLRVAPFVFSQTGSYVDIAAALGSWIYPVDDQGWIVPQLGLSGLALKRSGMVQSGLGGRSFLKVGPTPVLGLQANTANQRLAINGNGAVYPVSSIQAGDALRAIVSTVAGTGLASSWSSAFSVSSGQGIRVTCTYPSNGNRATIRTDYPDRIAGLSGKAKLNAPFVTVYVKSGSTIKCFTGLGVVDGATQQFDLNDWNAGQVITSLPVPAQDFGLFAAVSCVGAGHAAGNFPAGTLEVAYAFQYDGNSITSISHDLVQGCILTPDADLAQVFNRSRYYAEEVADLAALRALSVNSVTEMQLRPVRSLSKHYVYDITSTAVDDGSASSKYVRLNGVLASAPGRFVRDDASKWYAGTSDPVSTLGGVGDFHYSTNGNLHQKTSSTTWTLLGNLQGNKVYYGSTVPGSTLGAVGDIYFRVGGEVYTKTSTSAWTLQDNIRGIQGPPGTISTNSGIIALNHSSEPATGAGQSALYATLNSLMHRSQNNGPITPIAFPPQQSLGLPSDNNLSSRYARDLAIDTNTNTLYFSPSANSTNWIAIAGEGGSSGLAALPPLEFYGSPNGELTSRYLYDFALDTSTDTLYYSSVAESMDDWQPLGGSGDGGSGGGALNFLLLEASSGITPDAGQAAVWFSSSSGGTLQFRTNSGSSQTLAFLERAQQFTQPQAFTKGYYSNQVILSSQATVTPNLNNGNRFYLELYNNATLNLPTYSFPIGDGASFEILITQGASATITFNAGYLFPNGASKALPVSLGSSLLVRATKFIYGWYCTIDTYTA
jgi:hypothetical protein